MYHFLKLSGHDVNVIVPNSYPDFLVWMPGQEKILIYEENKKLCDELFKFSDILFSLDYNAPSRLGMAAGSFKKAKGIKVLIDHHIQPETKTYDHIFSTIDISSTSEIVYEFMYQINSGLINKSMAECIYAGIMTDTGSFSYACNYERTFGIVADLYKSGIDGVKINRLVYATFSENRLRLLGYALSEKLKVLPEYSTAHISLTRKELKHFNYQVGDTEGLVNYALSIKGIKFAALFTERKDKIRISLRSVGEFSVNSLANKHFEGGGHKNAAGGDSFLTLDETLKKFERLLPEYEGQLSK
jgi:phosphoesterase RecJ-like protein